MKSTELLNTKVIHKMLGEGIITEAGDNYVTVKFASKVSRFIFQNILTLSLHWQRKC